MPELSAQGLGTQLRHLLELLDGGLDEIYDQDGLNYRPRYTPVMRALEHASSLTIKEIATSAGISHSAASQTISKMVREGLVEPSAGRDGRERHIQITKQGREMFPRLQDRWAATQLAADELDSELPYPLSQVAADAISALIQRPFKTRIEAHERLLTRASS